MTDVAAGGSAGLMRRREGAMRSRSVRKHRAGFTLLETALAMVIIMVGVLAMIEAQGGFVHSNTWSSHEATGTYLANEIRERMRNLPRHDPVTGLTVVNGGGGPVVEGIGREPGEVTVQDFDDVDDYDGVEFGANGNFDGPIDAFGTVIPEVDANGVVRTDPVSGLPIPLLGWSQRVTVEKVDPYDFSIVRPWIYSEPPNGNFPGRALDMYPLRVTVTVTYQGPLTASPDAVTTMSWIVPAR
jgi:hypothetical protein